MPKNGKGKFGGDPVPSGKGGLKTIGETTSTKQALKHAGHGKYAEKYGRKK